MPIRPGAHTHWLLGMAAALLGGCAGDAAAPSVWNARVEATGSLGAARHELSPEERSWDCSRLAAAIELGLPDVARLGARARLERGGPPRSLTRAVARAIGEPDDGYPVEAEFNRARERLAGYRSAQAEKGCEPIDIEARLATLEAEAPGPGRGAGPSADPPEATSDPEPYTGDGFRL